MAEPGDGGEQLVFISREHVGPLAAAIDACFEGARRATSPDDRRRHLMAAYTLRRTLRTAYDTLNRASDGS